MLRTSTTRSIPCVRKSSRNSVHVRVECPMVKTVSILNMTLAEPRAETKNQLAAVSTEACSDGQWQRRFFLTRMIGLAGFTWKTVREHGHGYISRQRNGSPE